MFFTLLISIDNIHFQAGPLEEADEEFVEDAEDDEPRAGEGDSFVPLRVPGQLWDRVVGLAGEGVVTRQNRSNYNFTLRFNDITLKFLEYVILFIDYIYHFGENDEII